MYLFCILKLIIMCCQLIERDKSSYLFVSFTIEQFIYQMALIIFVRI